MTEQELLTAAATFKYSRGLMLWALEEQKPGECGYLGGCHDPADPASPDRHCTRHEALRRPIILPGDRADLHDIGAEKRYFDGLGDE